MELPSSDVGFKSIKRSRSKLDNKTDARLITLRVYWSQANITQAQAADRLGISQSCVNQYLNNKIRLNTDTIIRFARLFGISAAEIDPSIK